MDINVKKQPLETSQREELRQGEIRRQFTSSRI